MATRPPWSRAEALAAGAAFVARTGRLPVSADLHPASALPSYQSIKTLFETLAGYHAALGAPPPPAPRPPASVKERACLKCDAVFASAHVGVRICDACKQGPGFVDESGAWMNATTIVYR